MWFQIPEDSVIYTAFHNTCPMCTDVGHNVTAVVVSFSLLGCFWCWAVSVVGLFLMLCGPDVWLFLMLDHLWCWALSGVGLFMMLAQFCCWPISVIGSFLLLNCYSFTVAVRVSEPNNRDNPTTEMDQQQNWANIRNCSTSETSQHQKWSNIRNSPTSVSAQHQK